MHQGIVLCFFALIAASNIQTTFCLFDASLTEFGPIFANDTKFVDLRKLVLKKINRTHLIIGSFESFIDVNNDFEVLGLLNKKSGNQYRRLPYKIGPKPFCTFWDEAKMFMPKIRKVSNLPAEGVCPWKKQVYKIYGYQVDLDNTPKIFESGKYMAEIQVLQKGTILNGIRVYGFVEYI